MKTQKWTKEPWDSFGLDKDFSNGETLINLIDYERARACVNALSGLNPEGVKKAIEALKDLVAVVGLTAFKYEGQRAVLQEAFSQAEQAISILEGGAK